ncbi:MAG: PGPGW domain-containing protein [Nitrospirae bacterium]|nr:PGPGW domain-containing protein [Nitrospirota bacterium]
MQINEDKKHTITTIQQAKRVVRIVVGFTVLFIGVAMIVLPGPATVVIPIGLAILATEFVWARKLYKRFKDGASSVKKSIFNNNKDKKAQRDKGTE